MKTMTAQELKKLINYQENKSKYKVGQCLQVNEKTLQVCKSTAWNMYIGQYWIITKYDQDNNDYLIGHIKDNKIKGYMWFHDKEIDSFTLIN